MIELKNKLLKPTNDYVFKRIFGYIGNEDITKDFLNSILDEEVISVKLDCKEILEKDLKDDKFGVLDIKAEINDGFGCNIEMQIVDHKDIENRILYYWSRMYAQNIRIGQQYNFLRKTVIVLITDYEIEQLKKLKQTMSKWQIKEAKEGKNVLTELLEFYIIELPKFEKYGVEKDAVQTWIQFIENPEVMKMNEKNDNEALKKAQKVLEEISSDEKEQYLAEQRLMYIMDQKAIEAAGYDKGKYEEKRKIAKEMLKKNIDIQTIIECTNLTQEDLEKLKER